MLLLGLDNVFVPSDWMISLQTHSCSFCRSKILDFSLVIYLFIFFCIVHPVKKNCLYATRRNVFWLICSIPLFLHFSLNLNGFNSHVLCVIIFQGFVSIESAAALENLAIFPFDWFNFFCVPAALFTCISHSDRLCFIADQRTLFFYKPNV